MNWLPALAFVAALAAVVSGAMRLRGHGPARAWMRWSLTIAAGLSLATFLVLVAMFILVRTDIQYVFLYTSDAIPLRYRIAGAWAGREGSLLLWALYAAAVAAAVAWRHRRSEDGDDAPSRVWTEFLLSVVAAAYLGAVAWDGLFASTDPFLLGNRPGGNGLNPTLLSPFILIHPPVMFLAYALTAVPLAAVVADQITGAQAWSRIGMLWSRIDWLLYTFAMGLGGIWAYYTLGFGGYWAWDPVEVANLLPWLALTLFLHAQLHHRRYGQYRHIGPLLALFPFLLTVFSTISTRSGLWVSVHAFTDPTDTFDPDAGRRFLEILAREPSLQFHSAVFLVAFFAFLALWARRVAIDHGRFPRLSRVVAALLGAGAIAAAVAPLATLSVILEGAAMLGMGLGFGLLALTALAILLPALPMLMAEEERRWRLDMRTFNLVALGILGAGLLVLFLWHIAAVNGWSTETYLDRFPLLATPVLVGLTAFQARAVHGKRALLLAGGVLAAATLAWLVRGAEMYLLVLSIGLLLVSLQRVIHAGGLRHLERPIAWARAALWLAALANVVFWLNPPTVLGIWRPVWPVQLFMGAIAFVGLHGATELLCGRVRRAGATHLIVGGLAGFYIAAPVAIASWLLHRRRPIERVSSPGPRMHQVGLYGIHLAVAIVLLGYTTSAYLGAEEQIILEPGESTFVGGSGATLLAVQQDAAGGGAQRFLPTLDVEGTRTEATLYWEPQSGSYYPLPATARLWDRDVYFAVDGLCIDPTGACDRAGDWVRAYDSAGGRLPSGLEVTQVEMQAFELPGIGLVWTALFAWLYFMALAMRHGPEHG